MNFKVVENKEPLILPSAAWPQVRPQLQATAWAIALFCISPTPLNPLVQVDFSWAKLQAPDLAG